MISKSYDFWGSYPGRTNHALNVDRGIGGTATSPGGCVPSVGMTSAWPSKARPLSCPKRRR